MGLDVPPAFAGQVERKTYRQGAPLTADLSVSDHYETSDPKSPMRRDQDYLLVENCPDDAFQPGIDAIDAMLGTLRPE